MRIRLALGLVAAAAVVAIAAPASALPAGGLIGAKPAPAGHVEQVEFRRLPDGTRVYRRPNFGDSTTTPHLFYYRGYAYPYYPGYTYRLSRGELRSYDRPHRTRVVD